MQILDYQLGILRNLQLLLSQSASTAAWTHLCGAALDEMKHSVGGVTMNYELKRTIDSVFEYCDAIQELAKWQQDVSLKDIVRFDLVRMAMYISASDGTLAYQETRVLNDYFDYSMDPANVNKYIRENNIYSTEFENTVPLSLQLFVGTDNLLEENGEKVDIAPSEILLRLFEMVAREVALADGNVDAREDEDWRIYFTMLDNYLTENLNARRHGVKTGISKNSGVVAPKKGGSVTAPRKG